MYWFSMFKVARQSKEALIIVTEKNTMETALWEKLEGDEGQSRSELGVLIST